LDDRFLVVTWQDELVARILLDGARGYRSLKPGARGDSRWAERGTWLECTTETAIAGMPAIHVRDVWRWDSPGVLAWHRSWWHEGKAAVSELFAEVAVAGKMVSQILPGILYDGNAGAVPNRLVPRLAIGVPNLFEEHKFPTPMAHVEATGAGGRRFAVTLLPTPCAVVDGHRPDQWWSLGLQVAESGERPRLLSVSGRLAINGQDETLYDAQNHVSPYPDAWVGLRPRHIVEKHYRICLQADTPERSSWRHPLRGAVASQPALTAEELMWTGPESLAEAAALKVSYALSRWTDDGHCCGMNWQPNRPEFTRSREDTIEYGWVGQNMRLGLSLWRWGRRIGDADVQERGSKVAECWVRAAAEALAENKPVPTRYRVKSQRWVDATNGNEGYARPITETLYELAAFCRRVRDAGQSRPEWESVLFELLDRHARPEHRCPNGLLPLKWDARGQVVPDRPVTAGVLLVAALAEASFLPDGARCLPVAQAIFAAYARTFLGPMEAHPCGSALDSCCEDMESGMFLLMAATALHRAERAAGQAVADRLAQAALAADWVLTWAYTWNVPLLPGTILHAAGYRSRGMSDVSVQNRCLHPYSPAGPIGALSGELAGFASRGMSDVSVQNRHLHVYSSTSCLRDLATSLEGAAGDMAAFYRTQALRMLAPLIRTIARPDCRWGMEEDGEQCEQYNQTNYIQHPWDPVCMPRGGIARWFVPWMTVWVLSICLDFLEDTSED
jgi:hypothetical protein